MTKPSDNAIQQLLLRSPRAPAVSIYMPTHDRHSPPNMYEDQVRFKTLRSRAMDIIHNEPEYDTKVVQAIDSSLLSLQDDLTFWESRGQGLAVFVNPDGITTIDLPLTCDEYIAVDERFHVSPLLGLLHLHDTFYVLLVSEKEPLLFEGDSFGIKASTIPLLASGESGSETIKEENRSLRLPPKRSDARPEYFGDAFPVTNSEERLIFFKNIDRALRERADQRFPLLLAGTVPDIADYRSISQYQNILAGNLPYVNTEADLRKLHQLALSLIDTEITCQERQKLAERYEQLQGSTNKATAEISAIEDAANKGRIETLLMKLIRRSADTVRNDDTEVPKLIFLPEEQMATADYLAIQTWRNRGDIVLLEDSPAMPFKNAPLGAIFRY